MIRGRLTSRPAGPSLPDALVRVVRAGNSFTALTDDDLDRFLTAYGSASATRDADAAAALWGTPGLLLSDELAGALDSREDMAAGFRQGFPLYDKFDLAEDRHTVLERVDVTDAIVRIRLRWHFYDSKGEHLTDGDYEYVLRLDSDGPLVDAEGIHLGT